MDTLTPERTEAEQKRDALIAGLGLTLEARFIPFQESRNKDEKHHSLNWVLTLSKGPQSMLVEYMKGIAHIPGYVHHYGSKTPAEADRERKFRETCRTGKLYNYSLKACDRVTGNMPKGNVPPPTLEEVLYCLVQDASVLDCPTYESWAADLGYDEDSRKGEAIYQECLRQALQLKGMIGWYAMEQLQEAYQDY